MSRPQVLVVCTGNVCRSPYLEALLRHHAPHCEVSSAGTHALIGEDMTPQTRSLLDRAGVPSPRHAARLLTPEIVAAADLVLVATREHRAAVVRTLPKAMKRIHAVRDLSDLAGSVTDEQFVEAAGDGRQAVLALIAGRRGRVTPREAADADLTDPYRRSDGTYERMAGEVADALPGVLRALRHF